MSYGKIAKIYSKQQDRTQNNISETIHYCFEAKLR